MTDTMTTELPVLVGVLLEQWKPFAKEVEGYDEQLNTDGGKAALAKAALPSLGDEADSIETYVTSLFESKTPEQMFALDSVIRRVLRSVASTVAKYVEDNKSSAPELPDSEEVEIRAKRKAAVDAANALRNAVVLTQGAWAGSTDEPSAELEHYFPMLTNLRGGGRKNTGPRLRGTFRWSVNGTQIEGTAIGDVAKLVGVTNVELKNALAAYNAANGIEFEFKNPPATFSFVFVSGDPDDETKQHRYTIEATRVESDSDEGDDDDEPTFTEDGDDDDLFADS